MDAEGEDFEVETVLDNIGAGGLYLRLGRAIKQGAKLVLAINLSRSGTPKSSAPRVAARGVVLRAEPQNDGTCGVAIAFTRTRFF